MSVKLVFSLFLSLMLFCGCSSTMVANKDDSGPKRARILEEDITDKAKAPGLEPAAAPATGSGSVLPGPATGGVPLPSTEPAPSPKAPRRFQWKDSR